MDEDDSLWLHLSHLKLKDFKFTHYHLPHVKVRKEHYRRCLLALISVWFVGPWFVEWAIISGMAYHWMELAVQLAFFYDPVIAELEA